MTATDLHLFIAVTSAPAHADLRQAARETWLTPCKQTTSCDYRFFIDVIDRAAPPALRAEGALHRDVVLRGGQWCAYMERRHPYVEINYGNHHLNVTLSNSTAARLVPDYPHRGMYKVDWKVCYMRWAQAHNRMAAFHAYMEDDGFICVRNLLYQVAILRRLNGTLTPFRTGYELGSRGFDDSSTFMSREVAEAFATHYLSGTFACPPWATFVDRKTGAALSWGNSWAYKRCQWRHKLATKLSLRIHVPQVTNKNLRCQEREIVVGAAARPCVNASACGGSDSSGSSWTTHRERQPPSAASGRELHPHAATPFAGATNATPARSTRLCPSVGGLIAHHRYGLLFHPHTCASHTTAFIVRPPRPRPRPHSLAAGSPCSSGMTRTARTCAR
jgi:hypothetical protein